MARNLTKDMQNYREENIILRGHFNFEFLLRILYLTTFTEF